MEKPMKSNLTKLSLAFLSAVFILGCQDQGPLGPDALVPQFDKKGIGDCTDPINGHCHGDDGSDPVDATFTADFGGLLFVAEDGGGIIDRLVGPHGGKKNLQGGGPHNPESLFFSDFLADAHANGQSCYPAGPYGVQLSLGQNKPGSSEAIIRIFFTGKDKDGDTEIGYELLLRGTLIPAEWVPTDGNPATITVETFQVGAGGQQACSSTGDVDFDVVVTLNAA